MNSIRHTGARASVGVDVGVGVVVGNGVVVRVGRAVAVSVAVGDTAVSPTWQAARSASTSITNQTL